MKNKILTIIAIVILIVGMIFLNKYLNKVGEEQVKEIVENSGQKNETEIIKVTSENFEKEVLDSKKTVVIDFYADWCGPCKMYAPIVEKFAKENKDIKVVKINIDEDEDIALKYNIMSIPTTVVIKNGKETNRASGILDESFLIKMVD